MGLRVQDVGLRAEGVGFRAQGQESRVQGVGFSGGFKVSKTLKIRSPEAPLIFVLAPGPADDRGGQTLEIPALSALTSKARTFRTSLLFLSP